MKKKQRKISKFKSWIRAIALVLVVTFLWQDVLWAHPDIFAKETLATKTLPTDQDTAQVFEEFTLAYISHAIMKTEGMTNMYALSVVRDKWWPLISEAAYTLFKRNELELEKVPRVSDMSDGAFVNEGFVKITFSNSDELIIYDPSIYKDIPQGTKDITPKREKIGDKEYLKIAFVENSKIIEANAKIIIAEMSEHTNRTNDTLPQSSDSDEPEGNAIVGWKIEFASIIGFVFASLFAFATPFHDNQFIVGIALIYFLATGIVPILTGFYIDHSLKKLRHPRRKRSKGKIGEKAKDNLNFPFKHAGNIRDLREHEVSGAKGQISYYFYKLKKKEKKEEEEEGKLFVDKDAMRYIPKLLQWVIWFHEWLHGKAGVKTECVAVPLTFCGPWLVFGILLVGLNIFTGILSTETSIFLLFFAIYNSWASVIVKFLILAKVIKAERTTAGHYIVKPPKRKKRLTDSEIDAYIMRTAHLQHREGAPDEMYDSRDWLRGSKREDNIVFISCKDQAEDIIVYKAWYMPDTEENSEDDLARIILYLMGKRPVRLVIAVGGPVRRKYKRRQRLRVEQILKEAQNVAPKGKHIRIKICSTKYNLTRLRDLVELYRRRLVRIKHGNLEREAVASEVTGSIGRLIRLLDWAEAVGLKLLQLMGDYLGKLDENGEGYGFEGLDILRAHIESGKNPKLSLPLGRAEHRFMLAMLGHEWITDTWPTDLAYEGPAVIRSLKRLAEGEQIPGIPEDMRNEDIRKAQEFEELLKDIIISEGGDPDDPETVDRERAKQYRYHPKMIELADFIAKNMNFVFSKTPHHNVYLIGDIPENFTRRGLKFLGALFQMEDEFRQCTASGLRLHGLMYEAWDAESKIKTQMDIDERISSSLKSVDYMIAKVKAEIEFNEKLEKKLIENTVLEEMISILSKAKKDLDNLKNSTSRMRVEDRGEAEEALIRKNVQSFYESLEEKLKEITRQANLIFEEVFKGKDSPFMLATEDGMELSHDGPGDMQRRRYELGVNTVITPADFPSDIDFQEMGYVRVLNDGGLALLKVDSLSKTGETPAFRLILTATEATEFIKGQSIEAVARRKLEGVENILRDYNDLLINIPEIKYRKKLSFIRELTPHSIKIFIKWFWHQVRNLFDYFIKMFSDMAHRVRRFVKSLRSKSLLYYEAELEKGFKLLNQEDLEDAKDGLVALGDAFISEHATKKDRHTITDILLRNMGIGCDKDITKVATEVLENILALPIERKSGTREMCKDVLNRVYFWISRLGISKDEKEYKRRVLTALVSAHMRNEQFRMYIAEFANENPSDHKTKFVLELLSTTPEVKIGQYAGFQTSLKGIQELSAVLTAPYPEAMTKDQKRDIDAGKQKVANELGELAVSGEMKAIKPDTDEYRALKATLMDPDSNLTERDKVGLVSKLISMEIAFQESSDGSDLMKRSIDEQKLTLRYTVDRLADALGSKNVDGYIKRISCCTGLYNVAMNVRPDPYPEIAIHAVERLVNALTSSKVDEETKKACIIALGDISRQRLDDVGRHARRLLENAFFSKKIKGTTRETLQTVLLQSREDTRKLYIAKLLWNNKKIWMLFKFILKETRVLSGSIIRKIMKSTSDSDMSKRKPISLEKDNNATNKVRETPRLTHPDEGISAKDKIKKGLTYLMPRMRRTLFELSKKAENNERDIIVLLDMPSKQSEEVRSLITKHIINPLMRIEGNNASMEEAKKHIIFKDRSDINNIRRRILDPDNKLESRDVIVITSKANLGNFDEFKNSFITALDFSKVSQSQELYCPYVEATLFRLMRLLDIESDYLLRLHNMIPNVEYIDKDTLMSKYFHIAGYPIERVILELIDNTGPFNHRDLEDLYRFTEDLIRNA